MAKKKIVPETTSGLPETTVAPKKRRTPAKKSAPAVQATAADGGNGKTPTQAEIAEAAYFKHLNRGREPGREFEDWVEAERELRERRR